MATFRPGRLRRTLTPIIGSMWAFVLYSGPLGSLSDPEIHTVNIHRGKADRGGGSHPSTLEVAIKGQYSAAVAGNNVRFAMREPAADLLGAYLAVPGSTIAARFVGRLGQSSVEDTGRRFTTTYRAASWIAQMNYSPKYSTPTAGDPLSTVIAGLLNASEPLRGIKPTFYPPFDLLAATEPPVTYKDGIDKFATDLGTLLRETRNGETHVLPLRNRASAAQSGLASKLPLTRSQALSPATWEQNNERPAQRIEYTITNSTGGKAVRVAEIANPTGELVETIKIDWSYVKVMDVDSAPYREAYARVLSSGTRIYKIPSITVDLLYLIGSTKQYHRDQAGQLLALEAGDPVYFSGDWPAALQGVHFAEGITETINSNEWKLELSLVPYAHAVGDTPTPVVPPKVWDSAGNAWDNETKRWIDF